MKVTGEGRMKESITRKRRAASVANVGSQCDLSLKIPGDQKTGSRKLLEKPLEALWVSFVPVCPFRDQHIGHDGSGDEPVGSDPQS